MVTVTNRLYSGTKLIMDQYQMVNYTVLNILQPGENIPHPIQELIGQRPYTKLC